MTDIHSFETSFYCKQLRFLSEKDLIKEYFCGKWSPYDYFLAKLCPNGVLLSLVVLYSQILIHWSFSIILSVICISSDQKIRSKSIYVKGDHFAISFGEAMYKCNFMKI